MTPMETPRAAQGSANETQDWELVRRSLEGDHQAFAALVRRYERLVFRIAGGFVRDRGEVEDVA
jgi:DNA-directed RNA polymerase specialized sigma24 family protein